MQRILIIAERDGEAGGLPSRLTQRGFACSVVSDEAGLVKRVTEQTPDLVLVDMCGRSDCPRIMEMLREMRLGRHLPIVALIGEEMLNDVTADSGIDDFIIKPWNLSELEVRVRRVLRYTRGISSEELISCGDLIIDMAGCEVSLRGSLLALTFKEYELLKFLITNKGRVFTREVLLDEVWGYDYYGGDRTVDVHIRRLRSKIEDSTHTFIETVRNIGYKFRDET